MPRALIQDPNRGAFAHIMQICQQSQIAVSTARQTSGRFNVNDLTFARQRQKQLKRELQRLFAGYR
jgi:hypothetical protein